FLLLALLPAPSPPLPSTSVRISSARSTRQNSHPHTTAKTSCSPPGSAAPTAFHCTGNTESQSLHPGITAPGVGPSTRTASLVRRNPDKCGRRQTACLVPSAHPS